MFKYIVDSEATAKALSALVYKLMYPPNFEPSGTENYLFGWDFDGTNWLILIPANYNCPVFLKQDFEAVIQQLGQILNGAVAQGEGDALVEYLKTGHIILENIIPSGLTKLT